MTPGVWLRILLQESAVRWLEAVPESGTEREAQDWTAAPSEPPASEGTWWLRNKGSQCLWGQLGPRQAP